MWVVIASERVAECHCVQVYNITPYLKFHPGGVADLMLGAGGDCTALFNEYHAWVNGHGMLEVRFGASVEYGSCVFTVKTRGKQKCYIGELDPDSVASSDAAYSKHALDVKEWRAFRLAFKQTVSKSTIKLTFELPERKTLVRDASTM